MKFLHVYLLQCRLISLIFYPNFTGVMGIVSVILSKGSSMLKKFEGVVPKFVKFIVGGLDSLVGVFTIVWHILGK